MLEQLTKRFAYMPADGSVDRPILGAVLGDERTLYIDAGNSRRHASAFREAVRAAHAVREPMTALTHWHWDHAFGAPYERMPLIAHRRTREALAKLVGLDWSDEALDERVRTGEEIEFCTSYIKKEFGEIRDIEIALPDMTFDRSVTLHLGSVDCVIDHIGGVHADDHSIVYIPEERVLFLGDALGPAIYDGPRYYDAVDLLRLIDRVREYPAEWYIESHSQPVKAEAFWAEITEFRTLAELVLEIGDDERRIEAELAKRLRRELSEDDRRTVEQFVLGSRKKQR
ncbi:MBL fold metallo-hydrolase [Paenibacillus sp.]|uniref:MBL fold metallo-hydrolase n=1 Tax=Paenibacillus sp. TaxID=58172 RepID=UPI002D6023F5|nr:MBL fold metallo-hydrolase [Paenibacillus sp.]HZG84321.1 MBL fold metallo-hydrolase [Paenibacillus sp.]